MDHCADGVENQLLHSARNGEVDVVKQLLDKKRNGEILLDIDCKGKIKFSSCINKTGIDVIVARKILNY